MPSERTPSSEPRLATLGEIPPPPEPGSRRLIKPAIALLIALAAAWLILRPESERLDVYLHPDELPISDPALKSCIVETGISMRWEDAGQFTSLRCNNPSGTGIRSLEGIEHLDSLQDLNLAFNEITDASPLGHLDHLVVLELSHNRLSQLPELSAGPNLVQLEINYNDFTTLESLRTHSLGSLRVFSASHNRLKDISVLSGIAQLREISIRSNEIRDPVALATLKKLDMLDAGDNFIDSVAGISTLTNLRRLFLDRNRLTTLEGIGSFHDLERLDVGYNQLTEIGEIGKLTNLLRLSLRHTGIRDLGVILSLPDLVLLDITDNPALGCDSIRAAIEEYSSESVVFDQGCDAVPATRPE